MAPRAYRLRDRATSASATRERILEAARDLYRERGVAATTLTAIAERADVSRGTILHHFDGAEGLVQAVAQDVLASLDLPDEHVLDDVEDAATRIRVFVDVMVRFFARSAPWWTVFESQMRRPGLQAEEAKYWARLAQLPAAALGPAAAADRMTAATVSALLHPAALGGLIWALGESGLSLEETIQVIGDLLIPVVERARLASAAT
jgi:AcrR family transcriptional regulator